MPFTVGLLHLAVSNKRYKTQDVKSRASCEASGRKRDLKCNKTKNKTSKTQQSVFFLIDTVPSQM